MDSYEKYPRLFALPFQISLEPTPQRRDYQRVALENMLAFNASVCLSAFYQHISKLEEEPGNEVSPDLQLPFELDQMSIGKWNAIARETSKFLEEKNVKEGKLFWGPIHDLYHGADNKGWRNLVDKMISKRNQDAHGSTVYDEEMLKKELDERQDMLIKIFDMLSFYNDSTLLVPISVELIDRQMQRQVRVFEGLEETTRVTSTFPDYQSTGYVPLLHTPGIQNDTDKSPDLGKVEILSLHPMISVQPYEKGMHLFIYSKTLNRKRGDLNYLGINKSIVLEAKEKDDSVGEYLSSRSICHEFSKFRIRVEKEDLLEQKKPILQLIRKFILSKGKDSVLKEDELSVRVTIENTGNNTAENVQIKMPIPLMAVAADDTRVKDDGFFNIYLESLSQGATHSETLILKATKGGQHEFSPFTATYEYEDIKDNKVEIDKDHDDTPQAQAHFLEVLDPTDPDSMLPLVNISLEYSNITPRVGTNFDLKVKVHNVGKSVARDVDVHIFPPEKMANLVSGNTRWKGNLNPGQEEVISFTLLPKSPGIFSMKMRDIHYFNLQGDEFKTQAYEDYKVLIEEDAKATFQFKMEEYWKDLKLSESESRDIDFMKKTEPYKTAIFSEKGEVGAQIELEVKIKIIREVISKIASAHPDSDFKIREFNGNPQKEDCKWFAYVYQEMPVLLLLRIDDDKKVVSLFFNDPKGNKALTWRGEFRQVIFKEIELEKIINKKAPNGEKEGINGLKKLLNENFNRIKNSADPRLKFREDFIYAFGINDNQLSQFLHQENSFSFKIIFSSMQDDVLNRCKQIALKPFQNFSCVALNNKESSIVCSFEQKYRMAGSLRDNKNYKLVGQDGKELGKGQGATSSVAITTPRFSIKNDSEQFSNLPNLIQTFVKDCLEIQYLNLINDKKKDFPWLKGFVDNIQNNLQDISKRTLIVPEERKRDSQKNFSYEDGFSFLVDEGEDFLSTKYEFLRIDFNSTYVYLKTRYLDMNSSFDILKLISQKENIKFSIGGKGPWQYEIRILASIINDLEFDEIIKKLLIPAVSNIGEKDLIKTSFGVIRNYLNDPTWKGILKGLLETEDGLSFDECDNILNEPKRQRGRPITAKFGGISREFSTRVMENPLDADYKNENLRIKPEYRTLIYEVDKSLEEIDKKLSGIQTADEDVSNEVPDDSISDESQILSEDMDKPSVPEETSNINQDIDQLDTVHEKEN